MTPVELLLSKLDGVAQAGDGWSARCPAHYDRKPSLSVSTGDDGRALVHCHAGCSAGAVCEALGIGASDLFSADPTPPHTRRATKASRPKRGSSAKVYPTTAAALADLEQRHGTQSLAWVYHDADGAVAGIVVRWNRAGGKKDIRPLARHPDGWRVGGMPGRRPLYRLPELAGATEVVVCEGEPAADAARSLGFTATTSAGGCKAAALTDWSPLAGTVVTIVPDNDTPGLDYAKQVAILLGRLVPPARVNEVRLPGLPARGDIVDWLATRGDAAEPDAMRGDIMALARPVSPASSFSPEVTTPDTARSEPLLVCFADVEQKEVEWLWRDRIPLGRITLLVGRPGLGKSFLTAYMAAQVSTGADWPDGAPAPRGDVMFISAEDDPADTTKPRLKACGADCGRVHLLKATCRDATTGEEFTVAFDLRNVDLIRQALDRLPGCKLVVVDPVGSYLGGRVDAHRDNEVRAVLAPLAELSAERGVAVVLVCHTRKAHADTADDAVLGSRGFVGLARCVLHLMPDAEDRERRLLVPGKSNLGRPAAGLAFRIAGQPVRVEWEDAPLDGLHADDVAVRAGGEDRPRGPAPRARESAGEWLADLLIAGPQPVTQIKEQAAAAGLAWRTVRRAHIDLGIVPKKLGFAGGWSWGLPPPAGSKTATSDAPPKAAE